MSDRIASARSLERLAAAPGPTPSGLDPGGARSSRIPYSLPPRSEGQSPRDHALFLSLVGPQQGSLFPVRSTRLEIGRDSDADISLNDEAVSGRHARVTFRPEGAYVEDLASRNGTFVNTQRVQGSRRLSDGDHLGIGNTILKFSMLEELEERALTTLFELAVRDPLTRAYNRRHLVQLLYGELAFAERHAAPLSLLLVDIDHFKRVNDTFGHGVGDRVLCVVSASMQRVLRPYDVLCRFGGEEFMVIARNTNLRNAESLAERIRRRIRSSRLEIEGRAVSVTVSAGVVCVPPEGGRPNIDELFRAVDQALYRAKSAGRDRVMSGVVRRAGQPSASGARLRTTPPSGASTGRLCPLQPRSPSTRAAPPRAGR